MVAAKKEEKKGEETGCFGGTTSKGSRKEPAPSAETLAIEDAPAVINDAEKSSKDCGVLDLLYLDGQVSVQNPPSGSQTCFPGGWVR